MEKEDKLKEFLQNHHTESTTYSYYRIIMIYLEEQPQAKKASYKEVLNYLLIIRNRYHNGNSVKSILNAIKKYYEYLLFTGQRSDHPCRDLNVKDKLHKDVQLQDLLNEKQLKSLLNYKSKRFRSVLDIRDKSMLSLFIYQGITRGELRNLTINDINFDEGSIYIKSSNTSKSRTLELRSSQVLLFYKYINEIRPELIKRNLALTPSDILFINVNGNPAKEYSAEHIFESINKQGGLKVTINLIRQSVIALKLKSGNDIRMVQSFAGHKKASSTERYKYNDMKVLKQAVQKYHPLSNA
jgi:integrase/recombinase XerD